MRLHSPVELRVTHRHLMKPRFSLRALLIIVACLAALGYWRNRPRQIADQFVAALVAGDYQLANSLFVAEYDQANAFIADDSAAEFWAERQSQSTTEWLRGECGAKFIGKGTAFGIDGTAIVTGRGIERVELNARKPTPRSPWDRRFQ